MKIRTNLNDAELTRVGRKLQALAAKSSEIVLENPAEENLISECTSLFDIAMSNLDVEVKKLLAS